MATYDWGGWIILTDGTDIYKIKCGKQPDLGLDDPSAEFIDYPDDGHYGWSLNTRKREITISKIWFTTTARFEQFMAFLEASQDLTTFTLQIQISSTPSYWDWDGDNHTTVPIKWVKPKGIKKLYGGDSEIWEIKQMKFRQSGPLAA